MIDKVEHGASSSQDIAATHSDVISGGEEHLWQLGRSTADLSPLLILFAWAVRHQVAAVHDSQLVSVRAVRERVHLDVLFDLTSRLESFYMRILYLFI